MRNASGIIAALFAGLAPLVVLASACTGDDAILVDTAVDAQAEQGPPAADGGGGDSSTTDADADAAAACKKDAPFTTFTNLGELNTATGDELGFTLTPDERYAVYFTYTFGSGKIAIYSASRPATSQAFAIDRAELATVGDPLSFGLATPTMLYYTRGGAGELSLTSRVAATVAFGTGDVVNGPSETVGSGKRDVFHSQAGTLLVTMDRPGLPTAIAEWSGGDVAGAVFTASVFVVADPTVNVSHPVVNKAGTTIFYAAATGVAGPTEIHSANRTAAKAPFSPGTAVLELKSNVEAVPHFLSDDECRLYFSTVDRIGGKGKRDIWMATRGN